MWIRGVVCRSNRTKSSTYCACVILQCIPCFKYCLINAWCCVHAVCVRFLILWYSTARCDISSSLVVNTLAPLRCNTLAHSCLIILKRYCHGCDGFVRYKKQNPTTSTGHYARVRLPDLSTRNFFPLDQWYPHFYYLLVTPYFTCNPCLQLYTHFMHMMGVGTSKHILTRTIHMS